MTRQRQWIWGIQVKKKDNNNKGIIISVSCTKWFFVNKYYLYVASSTSDLIIIRYGTIYHISIPGPAPTKKIDRFGGKYYNVNCHYYFSLFLLLLKLFGTFITIFLPEGGDIIVTFSKLQVI